MNPVHSRSTPRVSKGIRGRNLDALNTSDVAIVGGGPAGLAAAIGAAQAGLRTVVLEKRAWPIDKACGEGLMPTGVHALTRLGVLDLIPENERAPFIGIRYIQEDGSSATAHFTNGTGIGIRRLALMKALYQRAQDVGVQLCAHTEVRTIHTGNHDATLMLDNGTSLKTRMVIAADGMASPIRHAAGLDIPQTARRFGIRQHFARPAWSPYVEIYFAGSVEAYVTPAGSNRVGVAFLWRDGHTPKPVTFEGLLNLFPALQMRLAGVSPDSTIRGAGPLLRCAKHRTADRLALLGDAAGYIDAISGEGLSLAFHCAEHLIAALPQALEHHATRASLVSYENTARRAYRKYAFITHGLLYLATRPTLRHLVVRLLGAQPKFFSGLLHLASSVAPPPTSSPAVLAHIVDQGQSIA